MFSILKRIMLTTVIAIGFMIGSMTVTAQADMPPTIAESACMIDVDTGKVLYQVYPTKWVHPASTTKIVTLITALDQYKDKLDQPLRDFLGSCQYGTFLPGDCTGRSHFYP